MRKSYALRHSTCQRAETPRHVEACNDKVVSRQLRAAQRGDCFARVIGIRCRGRNADGFEAFDGRECCECRARFRIARIEARRIGNRDMVLGKRFAERFRKCFGRVGDDDLGGEMIGKGFKPRDCACALRRLLQ